MRATPSGGDDENDRKGCLGLFLSAIRSILSLRFYIQLNVFAVVFVLFFRWSVFETGDILIASH